jgi:hypothetical protein
MNKAVEASFRLEELSVELKELILDLRDPRCPDPYARVYHFRREIGKVVATLGTGYPRIPTSWERKSNIGG